MPVGIEHLRLPGPRPPAAISANRNIHYCYFLYIYIYISHHNAKEMFLKFYQKFLYQHYNKLSYECFLSGVILRLTVGSYLTPYLSPGCQKG